MFSAARHIIGDTWRNPPVLVAGTALLFGTVEALRLAPMDAVFSGSLSWIQFFEIPIARFYLFLALAWLEVLRRIGALPYIFFFLLLGVGASCIGKEARQKYSPAVRGALVILELMLCTFALSRIGALNSALSHNALIIIATLVFFYLSFLAGDLSLRFTGMEPSQTRIRWIYALMLGMGAFAAVGVILGLAGFFTPLVLLMVMLTILITARETVRSHIRRLRTSEYSLDALARTVTPHFREYPFFKIFILLWLVINFALAFVPITAHDTKAYHLPIIIDLQKHGQFSFSRDISEYGWAALTGDTIYAIPTTLFFQTTAPFTFQIIQYSLLPLLLLVIYVFIRDRVRHPLVSIAAVVLILGIFDLQREALHGGYTDMFVYLFGIASALLLVDIRWRDPRRLTDVTLSSLFLGVALAVKLTAGFIAVTNGLFLVAGMIRDRIGAKKAIAYLTKYALAVILIAGFWYVKNAVVWGNPFYIGGIGGLPFTETLVAKKTILNMFLFPFLKFGAVARGDSSSELIVLGYFILAYAAGTMALLFAREKITMTHVLLFSFTQLHIMMIFFHTHHTRYMLSAVIMLPVLLALIADPIYQWLASRAHPATHKKILRVSEVCLAVVLIIFFIGNIRYFYVKILYKTGVLNEQHYIKKIGSQ